MKYRWRKRKQQEQSFNRLFTHLEPPELLQCVLALAAQWTELLGMMGYEVDPWREQTDRTWCLPSMEVILAVCCRIFIYRGEMVSVWLRNESSWAAQSGQIENLARFQPEYQLPLSTPHSAQRCQLHSNRTKLQLKPVICLTSCELVSLNSILSKYYLVHLTGCCCHWSSTSSIVSKHYGWRDSCEEGQYKPKDSRWHSLHQAFI